MKTSGRPVPADPTRAFQPTADRGALWLTGQYDDALRMMRGAVLGRQGLLVLVGAGGTGKTVVAHALTVRAREEGVVVGRLLYPILEGMDLLAAVTEAFGLPGDFADRAAFVEQFRRFVAETAATGRRVLLVVDEAQRLDADLLIELARLPYADGPGGAASLSVLLVGQRAVLETLRASAVEPDVLCDLRPLTREQTAEYVTHRLRAAGHRGRLFTPSALRKIWVVSEGVPRAVNALCVDALRHLPQTGRRTATAAMIDRPARPATDEAATPEPSAAAESPRPAVTFPRPAPRPAMTVQPLRRSVRPPRRRMAWLAAAAAVGLALGVTWGLTHSNRAPWVSATPEAATALTPDPSAAISTPEGARPEVTGISAPVVDRAERADFPAPMVREPAAASTPAPGRAPVPSPPPRPSPPTSSPRAPVVRAPDSPPAAAARPQPRRDPEPARAVEDGGDGNAIIDWLLKGRRAGGRQDP